MSYSSHTPAAPWSCWQVRSTARATSTAWRRRARTSARAAPGAASRRHRVNAGQLAQAGHGHGAVGQLELHGLERGDGLAELDAAVDVLHGQLHGPVHGAQHLPADERHVQLEVAARSWRLARRSRRGRPRTGRAACRGGRRRVRPSPLGPVEGGRRATRRRGRRGRRGARASGTDRERPAGVVAHEGAGHGVGEGDPAGGLAQRGGRGERVGVGAGVEVVDAERAAARRPPRWCARSGPPRPGGPRRRRRGPRTPWRRRRRTRSASSGRTGFTRWPPEQRLRHDHPLHLDGARRRRWRPARSASGPRPRRAAARSVPASSAVSSRAWNSTSATDWSHWVTAMRAVEA